MSMLFFLYYDCYEDVCIYSKKSYKHLLNISIFLVVFLKNNQKSRTQVEVRSRKESTSNPIE